MKRYKKMHIVKHALELYIKREGISEKDLAQEKAVLKEVTDDIEDMKRCYGIRTRGEVR